ncbi:amino acid/amide ABC transporter ATP-binding protein 1 (HAAT family) [Jezberella montanilacus]|jgi:ABC-type branched-subunit amino acid transport system ATPase component|uniref:Amino acid/amide ABC transporter ATP-binding protein 1 (HAAT family) n=1 Tax=Jezberella montanilacus TaxID=323426 RepID=A0A2T0XE87_9BURK|nr:ABC transporter ATP-binding protein [Jezberella montanilacus]PRY97221.1 amino acid/amide ABC transporter ATP-binding protein 1 (HAAT family) [Jezberella montanilacus]
MQNKQMISTQGLSLQFGGLQALQQISLQVPAGEFRGLIGPNGAGKTTLINCLSGAIKPSSGSIIFDNIDVSSMPPHLISHLGMSRSFQHVQLFGNRNVRDNILIGMHRQIKQSIAGQILGLPTSRRAEREAGVIADELLTRFDLHDVAHLSARQLPYGVLKRLDLARALSARPKLLLLDEPTSGMSEQEATDSIALLKELARKDGMTLIVIEHNMRIMMNLADRITVLHLGRIIAEGSPQEVTRDPAAIEAYLGEESTDA